MAQDSNKEGKVQCTHFPTFMYRVFSSLQLSSIFKLLHFVLAIDTKLIVSSTASTYVCIPAYSTLYVVDTEYRNNIIHNYGHVKGTKRLKYCIILL